MQRRRQQILDTAGDLLRRYGLAKTTVTEVARALGLTHGAVYRYFPTKAAPFSRLAYSNTTAEERLRRWIHKLADLKRRKVLDDPEIFATYSSLAESVDGAVLHHIAALLRQLEHILKTGFPIKNATARFHHPRFVQEDAGRLPTRDIDTVLELLLAGLKKGVV